jgi:hypothetical protein
MYKEARNNVTKNQPCIDGSWEIVTIVEGVIIEGLVNQI